MHEVLNHTWSVQFLLSGPKSKVCSVLQICNGSMPHVLIYILLYAAWRLLLGERHSMLVVVAHWFLLLCNTAWYDWTQSIMPSLAFTLLSHGWGFGVISDASKEILLVFAGTQQAHEFWCIPRRGISASLEWSLSILLQKATLLHCSSRQIVPDILAKAGCC